VGPNEKSEKNEKLNLEMRPVLVKLLQGFLTHDHKKPWEALLLHQEYVRNYFKVLGLYLHLNRDDGYAFLKTSPDENLRLQENDEEPDSASDLEPENGATAGSSLIRKMPLPFDVSLLLVLLRESLEQYDETVSDDYRLILKKQDIYELLKTFYHIQASGGDEVKLIKKFDVLISKVVSMGFLRELKINSGVFEVRRSIKAFMNASQLKELKQKMYQYVGTQKNV
jgi:hypothetical protein